MTLNSTYDSWTVYFSILNVIADLQSLLKRSYSLFKSIFHLAFARASAILLIFTICSIDARNDVKTGVWPKISLDFYESIFVTSFEFLFAKVSSISSSTTKFRATEPSSTTTYGYLFLIQLFYCFLYASSGLG